MAVRVCPPDKIVNPKTGQCVKRTGKIGRRLIEVTEVKDGMKQLKELKVKETPSRLQKFKKWMSCSKSPGARDLMNTLTLLALLATVVYVISYLKGSSNQAYGMGRSISRDLWTHYYHARAAYLPKNKFYPYMGRMTGALLTRFSTNANLDPSNPMFADARVPQQYKRQYVNVLTNLMAQLEDVIGDKAASEASKQTARGWFMFLQTRLVWIQKS